MVLTVFFILSFVLISVSAQAYEDKRCRCICPSPANVFNSTLRKERVITAYVPPNQCNCYGVILPKLGEEIKARAEEFCHRCKCKYETRNTTIIMVVVKIVLWTLTILAVYMIFYMCLNPLNRRKQKLKRYMETDAEEGIELLANKDADE